MTDAERERTSLRRVSVRISGRVQGVGYRYATYRMASSLGLSGWVRNLPSGEVEAAFEGAAEVVEEMVQWCRKGPAFSKVTRVDVSEETPRREAPAGFDIRY